MIPTRMFDVLKRLNKLFVGLDYAVIGSTAMALQGVKLTPNDIDIVTNKVGIEMIAERIKEYKIEGITHEKESLENAYYTSYYAKFKIDNVEIEILADTETINKKTMERHESNLKLKKVVKYKGLKIPVMPLEEELRVAKILYWKPDKIKILQEFLFGSFP